MYGDSHRDGGSPGCWESLKEGMGKSHGKLPRKLIQRESSDPSKAYMRVSCLNCKAKEQEEVGTRLPQKPQRLLLCSTVCLTETLPFWGKIHGGFGVTEQRRPSPSAAVIQPCCVVTDPGNATLARGRFRQPRYASYSGQPYSLWGDPGSCVFSSLVPWGRGEGGLPHPTSPLSPPSLPLLSALFHTHAHTVLWFTFTVFSTWDREMKEEREEKKKSEKAKS